MVESSLEHISKLKHLKSDAEMLIFHSFSKQNMISSQKVSIFQLFFNRFCENKVAVAPAALMGGPSRCSHSNFIFANVDISKVLVTFLVTSEAWSCVPTSSSLINAPESH